ncbi:hypothetical protein [Naasia aerilata]|uniref:Uncharacterized protein n=1 Tax=Naasia aerilata TaxID=1162966 RepID=A0ABN6XM44_9MICO|nr:hypothetical protein [Naasia aerilata]BDZ46054.1 hypothetical protein GCM10025866_19630 [Naasia aerilata]
MSGAEPGTRTASRPLRPVWRADGADRIGRYTRWLAIGVVPFLLAASGILYLFPGKTEQLFAWTIEPPLTAMLLGSAYVGGIWFFTQVALQDRWHHVKYGFPAVLVFATLLGLATFLHWDRFHFGHISFVTWVTLYVTTPFLTLGALALNWRADDGRAARNDWRIPRWSRLLLALVGAASLLTGLALFAAPQLLIPQWGWTLTPLTARILGGVLTLPGVVNLWLLADDRWSAFRTMFQAQLVSLVFLCGALALAGGGALDWSRPVAPAFVALICGSLIGYAAFYAWCEWGRRRAG